MTSRSEALRMAMAEQDPMSLATGERLRREFEPNDVAWALTQVELRSAAKAKFGRANEMLFTRAGLEQATRWPVAQWRAAKFKAAGVSQVWDLGCGIGADAMALAEAGIEVVGVELDEETAEVARHNLALVGGQVVNARAEEVSVPSGAAVFLDPARRTKRGRTWRVEDFTPDWSFVLSWLESERFVCVKLGPGVPKEILPNEVRTSWVSDGGNVVEASMWNRLDPGYSAVLLGEDELLVPKETRRLEIGPVGEFVIEPDGAVIRSGALSEIAPGQKLWLLADQTAYLSSDETLRSRYGVTFRVLEQLDFDQKTLRKWVRDHEIGRLEIKKRGIEIDPAQLRSKLKPKGPNSATLILARTASGAKALVVERV